ncbi:TPA: GTPase HflX, partial [Streptococcus pyogenes]|nr:GTPase HflX [Streptococcus pyogenes]
DKAYKLYDLNRVALLDHYTFDQEIEDISGYISPKQQWRLDDFYE